jgi:hypothetical protein
MVATESHCVEIDGEPIVVTASSVVLAGKNLRWPHVAERPPCPAMLGSADGRWRRPGAGFAVVGAVTCGPAGDYYET